MAEAAANLGYAAQFSTPTRSVDKRAVPDYYTPPAFQRRNVGTPLGIEDRLACVEAMLESTSQYLGRLNSYIISVESNGKATSECLMNMYDSMNSETQEDRQRKRAKEKTLEEQIQDMRARLDSTVNPLNNVNPPTSERVDRMAASTAKLEHHVDPDIIDPQGAP